MDKVDVIVVGDSGVGKTSLINRYVYGGFGQYQSTVGVDYIYKTETIDDKEIMLNIWDTAGQERFRSMVPTYYRKAQGVIIMFDTSIRETYENLKYWMEQVKMHSSPQTVTVIVGNKTDKFTTRRYEGDYVECSVKTGKGIDVIFKELLCRIQDLKRKPENVNLLNMESSCCYF